MLRILHLFAILVFFNGLLVAQIDSNLFNLDMDSISGYTHYQKIMDWNKKDFFPNRNLITHKLDSTHFYSDSGLHPGRGVYLYEKKRDLILHWSWDSENQKYDPDFYIAYTFDDGLLINQSFNYWDGDLNNLDESEPHVNRSYFYDENKRLIEIVEQDYQEILLGIPYNVFKYIYDSEGNLSQHLRYRWSPTDTDSLRLYREVIYRHNENNRLEQVINFDGQKNVLDSTHMLYNDIGLLEVQEQYGIDYRFLSNILYYYNEDESLDYYTEPRSMGDTNLVHTFYKYHSYGSLKQERSYHYNGISIDPIVTVFFTNEYTHNEEVNSSQIQFPRTRFSNSFWDNSHYYENHMIMREVNLTGGGDFPLTSVKYQDHFYSEIDMTSTDNNFSEAPSITIYPNPSHTFIKIEGEYLSGKMRITLSGIDGRQVLNEGFQNGQSIDVSKLPTGLYLYSVNNNDRNYVGKLMIE